MTTSIVLGAGVGAAALAMLVSALVARRLRRVMVVDAAWGAAFVAVALTAGVVAQSRLDGAYWQRWVVVALVVVWGLRLTLHLSRRVAGSDHDDPRYEEMLGGRLDEIPFARVVLKVFVLQGALVVVISAPVFAGVVATSTIPVLVGIGITVWLVGLVFEAVGDAQLAAYRSDENRPPILDTGLWGWTRHPNYFGDACIWWGIWLAGGAASGPIAALVTLPAPLAMTWFLTVVSGVRLTERRMADRPGWAEYAATTPMFLPRPPRPSGRHRAVGEQT